MFEGGFAFPCIWRKIPPFRFTVYNCHIKTQHNLDKYSEQLTSLNNFGVQLGFAVGKYMGLTIMRNTSHGHPAPQW